MYITGYLMAKSEVQPHAMPGPWGKRCGAHARQTGKPCGQPAMKNGRCRLHGGKSTGAKKPHKPIKHGRFTAEAIAQRKEVAALIRRYKKLLKEIK